MDKARYRQAIMAVTENLWDIEEFDNALSAAIEIVARAIDCEAGTIWFLNEDTRRLHALFHYGTADLVGNTIAAAQGLAGAVAESGEDIIVADAPSDERFAEGIDEETGYKTKSVVCVPLKNEEHVFGCVELINRNDGQPFDENDKKLLKKVVTLSAMTIEERGFTPTFEEKKETIIRLENITKEYPVGDGVLKVLKGINLDIYENEFLVILGESGCGKSTMLNIIGGMDSLTDGTLTVEGKDYSRPSEAELTQYRRDYVGFIFQSYNLMPNLTAQENVEFIAEISKHPIPAAEAIEKVGLTSRADNYPSQMSGGQQQRVSIARAIVKNPKVILADEPTAALDFQTGQEILQVIEDIVKKQNTTVVMITHNVEIAKMANRVVKLRSGLVSSIKINMTPLAASEIEW